MGLDRDVFALPPHLRALLVPQKALRNCGGETVSAGQVSLFRAAEFAVWEGVQQLRMSSLHQREHSLG